MTGSDRGFRVRALGEIAIRCRDLESMTDFYRDIIGLEVLPGAHREGIVFFRIGEGFAGHTAVLALFRDDDTGRGEPAPHGGSGSSLHHLALTVGRKEQDEVVRWYRRKGVEHHVEEFGWIGWRGVFASDPEGNTVEIVAYDPSIGRLTEVR
jgi:catechol 2,3-dioxygenase-like lactoylglutathione lyase family enzyme